MQQLARRQAGQTQHSITRSQRSFNVFGSIIRIAFEHVRPRSFSRTRLNKSLLYSCLAQFARGFDTTIITGLAGCPWGEILRKEQNCCVALVVRSWYFLIWLYTFMKDETLTQSSSAFGTAQIILERDQRLVHTMFLPRGSK